MVKTKLEEMNLLDKFLFDEAMEDRETYQAAISILLENEVELLRKPETEKELRISPQLREVRLDVVGMDREGKLYYTEMQKRDTGNLIRRSRYYQAQLDASLLEPGSTDFNLLNDSCFILIAPFDIFGRGLYRYTFEEVCRECPDLKLDDGAVRVFINTKGTNREDFSQEFLDFMEYIEKTTDEKAQESKSRRIRRIHREVCQIRRSEKAGVKYMQRWEELAYARQDGIREGRAEGRKEGRTEGRKEGRAEGRKEGRTEGRTEGKSEAVLQLLKMIEPVADSLQERILLETNIGVLEKWLGIAARVKSVKEFEDEMTLMQIR